MDLKMPVVQLLLLWKLKTVNIAIVSEKWLTTQKILDVKIKNKKMKHDPGYNKASKNKKVGIVGESHIWDGPLNQEGRIHGVGSSSGITGMEVSKYPCGPNAYQVKFPITKLVQG